MFLFETGFLGTKAPFFLDIATIYFAILPLLLLISIFQAKNKNYELHFKLQSIILSLTLIIIVLFEIGVRVTGGFITYTENLNFLSYKFLLIVLIIHVIIAIIALAGWLYLYINSYKKYKKNIQDIFNSKHKKIGKTIFLLLSVSSLIGILLYIFIFV